jgi:hypothetical protein
MAPMGGADFLFVAGSDLTLNDNSSMPHYVVSATALVGLSCFYKENA